jgi:hypothetical protein
MKELIRRILREEQEGPLTKKEIMLFKYIDKNKKETKTKDDLIKVSNEIEDITNSEEANLIISFTKLLCIHFCSILI